MLQKFGKIKSFYQSAKLNLKQLKKKEVNIENKEDPSNEPQVGFSKIKTVKHFEKVSITETLDPKTSLSESDTESFVKKIKFKKIFQTKKKMTPLDSSNIFTSTKDISSSSSFSNSVESLNAPANTFELLEQSEENSGLSIEADTCNEAEKAAKIVVFGSFINVSF